MTLTSIWAPRMHGMYRFSSFEIDVADVDVSECWLFQLFAIWFYAYRLYSNTLGSSGLVPQMVGLCWQLTCYGGSQFFFKWGTQTWIWAFNIRNIHDTWMRIDYISCQIASNKRKANLWNLPPCSFNYSCICVLSLCSQRARTGSNDCNHGKWIHDHERINDHERHIGTSFYGSSGCQSCKKMCLCEWSHSLRVWESEG